MRRLLYRLAPVMLVALAWFALVLVLFVLRHGGDLSALTRTGPQRAGRGPYRWVTCPVGSNGYDGQFYYVISQDPWRPHIGEMIDVPAARHLRVLYPAVCWLFSGGDPRRLLWVMPLVNGLALAGVTGLGAWLATRHGRSPWWGLTFPVALNVVTPAMHNLTDPLATLSLACLLAGWLVGASPRVLGACALGAMLSREQNVLVVGILLAAAVWRGQYRTCATLGTALAGWTGWVGLVWLAYGQKPFLPCAGNFDWPLTGMAFGCERLGQPGPMAVPLAWLGAGSLSYLAVLLGVGLYTAMRPGSVALRLITLAGVALALLAGQAVYCDFWAYTRIFVWIPLGVWLLCLRSGSCWPVAALLPAALWPIAGALR